MPLVTALALSLLAPVGLEPLAQAATGPGRPDVSGQRVSKVTVPSPGAKKARGQVATSKAADDKRARAALTEQKATWPEAATGSLTVAATRDAKPTKVGTLPVTLKPRDRTALTGHAKIQVLGRKQAKAAGITGVVLTAQADQPGRAEINVDYSAFGSAYGGDWAGRLRLVRLPQCALTTPKNPKCQAITDLGSVNHASQQSVSAPVTFAASPSGKGATTTKSELLVVALAATGESAGGSGSYAATPLTSSSKWEAGSSSGSFSWSYPMAAAPAAAGPVPDLALSYDTGGIDGRTASTNNQSSPVGEGFNAPSASYVERSYGSCDEDGHVDQSDLCWKYDNASLVLNGTSTELVKDDTSGKWRLANDDASTVITSTGATNGDDNGETWTVITGDGTKYVFGMDKLPGAGVERTNSVWTVPVYGDDSGEPGYSNGSAFADRSKQQAWRWNLDYVEDTHGNAMTYWYTAEVNHYKKNKASTANAQYTRGGHLDKILYGQPKDALFTSSATARVAFSYGERCFATGTGCDSLTEATADNWPDVPYDSVCSNGSTTCNAMGPAFFTRKRLTKVETGVWNGTAYAPIDSWAFGQKYEDGQDIGNTSDQTLVLTSITRTGHTGTAIRLDPVSFTYQMRPNRVAGGTVAGGGNILPLTRPRIHTITTETGAITTVTLSPAECVRGSNMPVAEDTNSKSCYPTYWNINGAEEATLDWFHKYRVIAVGTNDPVAGSATENEYVYENPAWHYNDSPFTPQKERTWSLWRGYAKVTSYTGRTDRTRSKSVALYMQGMNGDRLLTPANDDGNALDPTARRTATVIGLDLPGLSASDITDAEQYQGFLREQITYDGTTPISVAFNVPWSSKTATQHKSYADIEAYYVRTAKSYTNTYLTVPKTWRSTSVTTTFDSYGMATKVDAAGDTAKTGDESCTRTWYARNDAAGINALTSRTRTVGRSCATPESSLVLPTLTSTRGDVLSDTAATYDDPTASGWNATQTPTKGEATWLGRANGYPAVPTLGERHPSSWQKLSSSTYDTLGRVATVTNVAGHTVATAFTPTGHGPLTKSIFTNAKSQKVATFYDGLRGQTLRTYDINLKKTELTHDALGRLTGVWLPDRNKDGGQTANTTYTYSLERSTAPSIATSTLKTSSTRSTSYELFDALLRPLQTQTPTPLGGRILTDLRYDDRGLSHETYSDIYDNTSAPNATYTRAEYGEAPAQSATSFDGAARPTTSNLLTFGTPKWSTTTSYTGDSTATTAVQGGQATRTITDALGRTVERREYTSTTTNDTGYGGADPAAPYAATKFAYTVDGKQNQVTGPDNTKWTYSYDLFGRQTGATDPDTGSRSAGYTPLDQIDWNRDAAGKQQLFDYDELNRKTKEWTSARTAGNLQAEWKYDTLLKGRLDSSVRYEEGNTAKAYTKSVLAYDVLGRQTKSQLTLPPTDTLVVAGAAQTSFTFESGYNLDGSVQFSTEPAAGGLAQESVSYGYTATGQVATVSGTTGYLLASSFSALGQVEQQILGTSEAEGTKKTTLTNVYEQGTGRLTHSDVTTQTAPYQPQDLDFSYDQAGNVTKIADTPDSGTADIQCFTYDGYRRLSEAWTPATGDCASKTTGGAAPYRTGYTYNSSGQRTTETTYNGANPIIRNYCYADTAQPHTLTATTTAASCTGVTPLYQYENGNTTQRPGPSSNQTLTWNAAGKITGITEGTKKTDFVYDADGQLLIRRATGDGESVLYLGASEIHYKVAGATKKTWASRSYGANGKDIAVRTNESGTQKLTFIASDHHGTSSIALDAATQAVTKRYTTPFGASRAGGTGSWPDDKGFLGKPTDKSTGLTHIGAREYDPAIGQFISVDPLLSTDQAQSLNGYAYANNNPASMSDPSGLRPDDCLYNECTLSPGGGWEVGDSVNKGDKNEKTKTNAKSDYEDRQQNTNHQRSEEQREKRFAQIIKGKTFYGKFLDDIDDINDRSCRMEPGGKAGCRAAGYEQNEQLEDVLRDALDRIDESWVSGDDEFGFEDHEFEMALKLALEGHTVTARGSKTGKYTEKGEKNDKSFDAWVDGVRSEFKKSGKRNIKTHLRKADEQGADAVYLWTPGVSEEAATKEVWTAVIRNRTSLSTVTTWNDDGLGWEFTRNPRE
ncbi:RHS repeat-associated core domain-containing protein [Streptomyces microflavus]|uniref:RHS repeat-associated core domain-containing protein n=1 Tax=Streptomyces microflavus TaxID=1919 RepID=UPI00365DB8AF